MARNDSGFHPSPECNPSQGITVSPVTECPPDNPLSQYHPPHQRISSRCGSFSEGSMSYECFKPPDDRPFKHSECPSSSVRIAKWPSGSQELKLRRYTILVSSLIDILLISAAVCWLVYAIFVINYSANKTQVDHIEGSFGTISQISKSSPTVFSILFAAAITRILRAIALWRLEKGEKISVLDRLIGSTSVSSAVATQIELRSKGVLGVSLILLWTISPLGSQATIRLLETYRLTSSASRVVTWMGMDYPSLGIMDPNRFATAGSYVNIALLSSLKDSNTDVWDNIKIPIIENFDSKRKDETGWIVFSPDENLTFSSLIGTPVANIPYHGHTEFFMEEPYFTVQCPKLRNSRTSRSRRRADQQLTGNSDPPFMLESVDTPERTDLGNSDITARPFAYVDSDIHAECELRASFVECGISCEQHSCEVTKIRPSTKRQTPLSNRTALDGESDIFDQFARGFMNLYQNVSGGVDMKSYLTSDQGSVSAYSGSIMDSSSSSQQIRSSIIGPDSPFPLRLSQLMNTYWLAVLGGELLLSNLLHREEFTEYIRPYKNGQYYGGDAQKAAATTVEFQTVIRCNAFWTTVHVFCCCIILLCGVGSIILRGWLCRAPTLSMNASTMVRILCQSDAAIASFLPTGGTVLTDGERGNLLRDVKIRLGDMRPDDEETGRIGLLIVPNRGEEDMEKNEGVVRLKLGRFYE